MAAPIRPLNFFTPAADIIQHLHFAVEAVGIAGSGGPGGRTRCGRDFRSGSLEVGEILMWMVQVLGGFVGAVGGHVGRGIKCSCLGRVMSWHCVCHL